MLDNANRREACLIYVLQRSEIGSKCYIDLVSMYINGLSLTWIHRIPYFGIVITKLR
jgi:hypothetical protein